jgi:alpha-galactosidase
MHSRIVACLSVAVSLCLLFPLAAVRAGDLPVMSLPAHLAESGIPTWSEVGLVNHWLAVVAGGQMGQGPAQTWCEQWLGTGLPFSFRYDGRDFTGAGNGWQFTGRHNHHRETALDTADWTWLHAKTGLKVTWHVKRFFDYPAVDTLLTFENTGSKDTALIENVRNLDLKLAPAQPGKRYTIHGAHGGRCGADDFMPFTRTIAAAPVSGPSLTLLRQDYETLEINRSVIKTPLAIGQRKFEHGLGTHSVSRIRLRSPKPIDRFSAWIGVDNNERTRNGAGSVVFSVSTEEKELFRSDVLRGGQAAVKVDLDSHGTKTLYLDVGDAGDGPNCDHADWADAMVTFQGGQTARLDEFAATMSGVVRFGSGGSSSNEELPFFNIETPDSHGVLVGLGWTGVWQAEFNLSDTQLEAKAGMTATRFVVHPGECLRGPRVLMVFWNGQRLHGHNMLRRLLYEHYVPRMPNGKPHQPLVSVNTCFTYHGGGAYLEGVTEQSLSALVKPFIELGAEAFVIDAGYFNCNSWMDISATKDYSYSKQRFPHGFRPLSEPLAKAGAAFGLWFVPEVFGNMGDPHVREAFLAVVDKYVKEQGMTMYRQDGGGTPGGAGPDRVGVPEMQHIAGLYEMQDQIRRRHPEMLMEGCCGGGRRIDLESVSRFHWHQKSDSWFHTVTDEASMYGGNLYLPGGVLNLPTAATDNVGLWSSFGGQLCLAWHPLDKDFPMELAKRQVKLYKRVRPYLSGDFYPLTDCTLDRPWQAYQFDRNDLGQGFALIFKRNEAGGDAFTFAPRGLAPQAHYAISCQASGTSAVHTGAELAKGIPLTLKATPDAELVIYEKQP